MIIEIKHYTNEKGMSITERVIIDNTNPKVFDRFQGTIGIGIDTPMGPQMEHVSFPITAETIAEAFEKFEQYARAHVAKMKAEMLKQQQQVVVPPPGAMKHLNRLPPNKGGLILPP